MMRQLAVLFLALGVAHLALGQSADNFTKLQRDIITIDPRVRPVKDYSKVTQVTVSFHLTSINGFETVNQKLISNGWLMVVWQNEYMVWDPADYGGAMVIYPDPDKVWRPRLSIINTMKDLKPIGEDYIVMQHCQWDIFVWGEDLNVTDIHPALPYIELDTYTGNGEWELMSTRAWRSVRHLDSGSFPFVHFEITIRRRPSLTVLTVLLPVTLLAAINVYVFTIPSESGERLSYAITALLSFGVFMSFIMDHMPSSAETISIVAINMSFLLILSAVYVLLCILSLRLFHRDDHKHPVPKSLQTVIVWLEVLVCLDPPSRNKVHVIQVDNATSDDVNKKGKKVMGSVLKKWRHDAYTDPAEMTWRRVSRTLDKLFFRLFFVILFATTSAALIIMVANYVNYS
ncbi:hypothetical protein BaRGS_00013793 [Batillaria attramentaria]|uniref:Uncharacterized protein n=1 Tax=Batillaria attramentaria TaxID=370345 RepID=A0ABD0L6C5_9CAEN